MLSPALAALLRSYQSKGRSGAGFRRDQSLYEVWQDLKVKFSLEQRYFSLEVHGKRLMLAKDALYVFREDVPTLQAFRLCAVWITEWRWFDRLIIAVIAMNIVATALPVSYDPDSATQGEVNALLACNAVTILIFTFESVMKIIARGLILSDAPDRCYLRQPLNWLDLFVVITSLLELFVLDQDDSDSKGFVIVRAFRVLRPLRSIKVMPQLGMIVTALVESGRRLGHVLVFIGFIFSVIALAGRDLFGLVYWQRCRLTPQPVAGVDGSLAWPIDPAQPRFCGGRYVCTPTADGNATYCGSLVSAAGGVLEGFDPWPEISENPGADFGYSGFQTFGIALLTTFRISTTEGWTDILYRCQDGEGSLVAVVFICSVVLFGGLILMNLVLAILWERFSRLVRRDCRVDIREDIPEDILSMKLHELVAEYAKRVKERKNSRVQEQVNQDLQGAGLKTMCLYVCSRPWFENFFLAVVIVNAVILSLDSHPPIDSSILHVLEQINLSCTLLFALELVIKMVGKGVYFWGDQLNLFDFVLVALSVVEVFTGGKGSMAALRTARLLRIFRFEVFNAGVGIRVLLRVLQKAIMPTYSFTVVATFFLYSMALLGLQLFFSEGSGTPTDFPRFDTVVWALISSFAVLAGEDWSRNMVAHIRATSAGSAALVFHLSAFILGHMILMSLFLGIFAAAFAQARDELLQDYRHRLVELRRAPAVAAPLRDTARPSFAEEEAGAPEEAEAASPRWPDDVLGASRRRKTSARDMNLLRMVRVKQAAARRKLAMGETVVFGSSSAASAKGQGHVRGERKLIATRKSVSFLDEPSDGQAPTTKAILQEELVLGAPPPLMLDAAEAGTALPASLPTDAARHAEHGGQGPVMVMMPRPEVRWPNAALPQRRPCRTAAKRGVRGQSFKELVERAEATQPESPRAAAAPVIAGVQPLVLPERCDRGGAGQWALGPSCPPVELGSAEDQAPSTSGGMERLGQEQGLLHSSWEDHGVGDFELSVNASKSWRLAGSHGALPPYVQDGLLLDSPRGSEKGGSPKHSPNPGSAGHLLTTKQRPGASGWARSVALSPMFEPAILVLIVISCICLAVESPYRQPKEKMAVLFRVVDFVAILAFTAEMAVRMVAFGLWHSPTGLPPGSQPGYFRVGWNYIDFVCVISGLIDVILELASLKEKSLKLMRAVRTLRVLRPFRLVKRYKGVKVLIEALLTSVPTLLNVVGIMLLFYLGFGILLVNLLKGKLWHCSLDPTGEMRPDIVSRQDCLSANGEWMNSPSNFDHIGNSLLTLLHVGTGEGWIEVMMSIVNSAGVDMQPRPNSQVQLAWFIIVFVALSNFVFVNLFIGVLIDAYMVTKAELDGEDLLTWEERLWIQMQRKVFFNPDLLLPEFQLKGQCCLQTRQRLRRVIESRAFEVTLLIGIIGNTLLACISHPTQSRGFQATCQAGSMVFLVLFNVEALLKAVVFRKDCVRDAWNVFDLVAILGSDISMLADLASPSGNWFTRCIRVVRAIRILRLVRLARFQRMMLCTLWGVMPGLANVVAVIALIIFMYACLGVGLFGTIADGGALGPDANFHSLGAAALLLVRVATGERWHLLMFDTVSHPPGCSAVLQSPDDLARDGPQGCGTPLGYPYFATFVLVVSIVLMNLIIAVVLDGFSSVQQLDNLRHFEKDMVLLSKTWRSRDRPFSGLLELDEVVQMLLDIPEPVGFRRPGQKRKHVLHQMRWMQLYDGKRVHFRDIVMLCAKRSYLWMCADYERNLDSVRLDGAILERWYGNFPDVPRGGGGVAASLFGAGLKSEGSEERPLLIGHVIVATYLITYCNERRRQWVKRRKEARASRGSRPSKQPQQLQVPIDLGIGLHGPHAPSKSSTDGHKASAKGVGPRGVVEAPRDLQITIVGARGLRDADAMFSAGTSDAFCRCMILSKPNHWIQTPVVSSTDPQWNYSDDLINFLSGDSLEFTVYDDDPGMHNDLLGKATLESAEFHPAGFEGELPLREAGEGISAFLSVKVAAASSPEPAQHLQSATLETDPEAPPNILMTQLLPPRVDGMQELSPLPWPPLLPSRQEDSK